MMTEADENEILDALFDDAFVIMNWARREGFKRDAQRREVVSAFRKTLADRGVQLGRDREHKSVSAR